MSATALDGLTPALVAQMMRDRPDLFGPAYRDALKDKSYQRFPMGREVKRYLASKRKELTVTSQRGYETFVPLVTFRIVNTGGRFGGFEGDDRNRTGGRGLSSVWTFIPANWYNLVLLKTRARDAQTPGLVAPKGLISMRGQPSDAGIYVALFDANGAIEAHMIVSHPDCVLLRYRWSLHRSRDGVYVKRTVRRDGRLVSLFLHRAVLGLEPDDLRRVDHINGDTLDNRRANLRIATTAENAQNQESRGGSSRYRGVTWDKSRAKWMASAMLDGRRRTIGRFASEDEAGTAVAAWRREHMPFSADAREAS